MFKNTYLIILSMSIIFQSSCTEIEEVKLENNFVAEAFLFAGEPVNRIRLKTTFPLSSTEDISDPINDALIQLTNNGTSYQLISSGMEGYYHYPDNDLTIEYGAIFELEINYKDRIASAQTHVPSPPTGVDINVEVAAIPRVTILDPFALQALRDTLQDLFINVSWENTNEDWYYIVVENVEAIKNPIFPQELEEALQAFRFISDPTQNNSQLVIGAGLRHYGTHRVTVYRVNQEYADLFENSTQDSRDLNEPPSNIDNALGIFTAFASDSIFFEIIE